MSRFILVLFLLPVTTLAGALKDKTYGNVLVDEVTSVYDGDTFRVNIKSWPSIVGDRVSIRISGIDTPELRAKCAHEKQLARKAKQVTVQALRGGEKIELKNIKRGKYFRLIADVYVDGNSLAEKLITSGLAVPYFGGTKVEWCK